MKLYGLMITKDDEDIFDEWCQNQLALYDAVVCLDGSSTEATSCIARRYPQRLIYLHERDFEIPFKTDHGLRRVVHEEIVRRFGLDNWIMCCHADEFCYHDPRKVALKAQGEGYDLAGWYSLLVVPHPSEWSDWAVRQHQPITERFRHYHWNFQGDGFPWYEDRLYRNGPAVYWDSQTHGSVQAHGLKRKTPWYAILLHYKVFTTDLAWYEGKPGSTFYRQHWQGLSHRTGLPYGIEKLEDFFVGSLRDYIRCDRFEGTIPHAWNIGEEYRP